MYNESSSIAQIRPLSRLERLNMKLPKQRLNLNILNQRQQPSTCLSSDYKATNLDKIEFIEKCEGMK
jgi:hypothetical protein